MTETPGGGTTSSEPSGPVDARAIRARGSGARYDL